MSPPGCVDPVNAQQGLPEKATALGALKTTIPEPPEPPDPNPGPGIEPTPASLPPAPPPPPVFAVPLPPFTPQ